MIHTWFYCKPEQVLDKGSKQRPLFAYTLSFPRLIHEEARYLSIAPLSFRLTYFDWAE